jgi:putative addiction module CopG family antidote
MPTRNVNLTDELDRFVAKKVRSGRYENASEVVRAGLRTLERDENMQRSLPHCGQLLTKATEAASPKATSLAESVRRSSFPSRANCGQISIFAPG